MAQFREKAVQLTENYHDREYCFPPEHNVLSGIRREFGKDWKHVGLGLKLDNSVLTTIELDSQHSEERAFNMLCEWMRRDTTSCYCKLISAMNEQGLGSGVVILKKKIKSMQPKTAGATITAPAVTATTVHSAQSDIFKANASSQQDVNISDHSSLLEQDANMWELIDIVIPNIMHEWETLAFCMKYTPGEVESFRKDSKDLKECCTKLFKNWLTTGHGPKPKTYQILLKYIKKIRELQAASDIIEKELIKDAASQQDVKISDDSSLLAQDAMMWELINIVIPNIMHEWEALAFCMRYTPEEVESFRKDSKDLKEFCTNLFKNWLTTNHGPKPKTYQTLLKYIKKIKELTAASEIIEK